MRKVAYLSLLLILIGLTATAQDSNSPPEVTNVVTQQVEISYDLLGRNGDSMTVSLLTSSDGAAAFIWKPRASKGRWETAVLVVRVRRLSGRWP